MIKASDLREKEVINVNDGSRLGLISDIEVDLDRGEVKAIIIPGPGKILGFIGKNNEQVIRWENIVKIGNDVILVNLNSDYYNGEVDNND